MINKIFRRTLAASTFLISASIIAAPIAKALPTSNGTVTGTVDPIADVVYTQPTSATTLSPTSNTNDMDFGSLNVHCNDADGWSVTVDSLNDGVLSNGSETITYSGLEASGTGAVSGTIDVSSGTPNMADVSALTCAASGGCDITLTADILATDVDGKPAGSYTDTLTFTITTK